MNVTTQQNQNKHKFLWLFYRAKEDSSYAGYHLSYEVKKLMYASISQSSLSLSLSLSTLPLIFVLIILDECSFILYSPYIFVSFGILYTKFTFLVSPHFRSVSAVIDDKLFCWRFSKFDLYQPFLDGSFRFGPFTLCCCYTPNKFVLLQSIFRESQTDGKFVSK